MPQDLTINGYTGSIRVLLDGTCTRLEEDLNEAEKQFAPRQTGTLIRKALDLGKQHFDRTVTGAIHEMQWFLSRTSVDRSEVSKNTVQELTNFLNRTKAIIGSVKRRARGGMSAKMIEQELTALDRSLLAKMELAGLPIVVRSKPTIARSRLGDRTVDHHIREEVPFAALFADARSNASSPNLSCETAQIGTVAGRKVLAFASISSAIRDCPEKAQLLARTLHRSVTDRLEIIKAAKHDHGDGPLTVEYLANVARLLDQIATALGGAKLATTSEQRDRNFEEATALAVSLAKSGGEFAKKKSQRIAGDTINIILYIILFGTTFGVSSSLGIDELFALLKNAQRDV
jgi:hypothetical protein